MTLESLFWIFLVWFAVQVPAAILLGRFIATARDGAERSRVPEHTPSTPSFGQAFYERARPNHGVRSGARRVLPMN